MRKNLSIAIFVTATILTIIAAVANINHNVELQQVELETKSQVIENLEQQLENTKVKQGDSQKTIDKKNKKIQELQSEVERLQAKKAEEARIAAEQARNAVVAAPVQPQGNIQQIVADAANRHGLNPTHFLSIANCESGFNPNAVNHGYYENGHPSGLFQHLSGYWPARAAAHGYPGASVFDPVANANVTASMWATGSSHLWECQ